MPVDTSTTNINTAAAVAAIKTTMHKSPLKDDPNKTTTTGGPTIPVINLSTLLGHSAAVHNGKTPPPPGLESNAKRLLALQQFFVETFAGGRPDFFVCVPGRVNLIGEHIDYNDYPVLPMAIRQNILMAVQSEDAADDAGTIRADGVRGRLQLRNMNRRDYGDDYDGDVNEFEIAPPSAGKPHWYKYVLCGLKGVRDRLRDEQHNGAEHPTASPRMRGMRIAVSGNIPAAAGLSSSSALVSAALLAACRANASSGIEMAADARELARWAARSERSIGTEGGGMDQAAAFLSQAGAAMFIDWRPVLRTSPVRLPPGVVFVIANSMAQANKADSASGFNRRVVECRLACCLVAKAAGLEGWRLEKRMAGLEERLAESGLLDGFSGTRSEFGKLVERTLGGKARAFSRAEVLKMLDCDDEELVAGFLTENTRDMEEFWLYERAKHVVEERDRVYEFRDAAVACDKQAMGRLMSASHRSLDTLYDCSHECLNRMIELGASRGFASRLTGAGWGGCTVALCESAQAADEYIRLMHDEYYAKLPLAVGGTLNLDELMFATSPQGGAVVIENDIDDDDVTHF